jgi:hypothetical protein
MSYTSTHRPTSFRVNQGFYTVKGRERHGWRTRFFWDKKTATGRPLWEYCPHVHRTESAATWCGEKGLKS